MPEQGEKDVATEGQEMADKPEAPKSEDEGNQRGTFQSRSRQDNRSQSETVWEDVTDGGILVRVIKRVKETEDGPRTYFSVTLQRDEAGRAMPLHAKRDDNITQMVEGLEEKVSLALLKARDMFVQNINRERRNREEEDYGSHRRPFRRREGEDNG